MWIPDQKKMELARSETNSCLRAQSHGRVYGGSETPARTRSRGKELHQKPGINILQHGVLLELHSIIMYIDVRIQVYFYICACVYIYKIYMYLHIHRYRYNPRPCLTIQRDFIVTDSPSDVLILKCLLSVLIKEVMISALYKWDRKTELAGYLWS